MAPRSELQALLETLVDNVYHDPPETLTMNYPCIVYNRDFINIRHADNRPYKHRKRYQITVVDRDPDSEIPDMVAQMPSCSFVRSFTADNLHHDVFNLFF
jgi:hypothetical protein